MPFSVVNRNTQILFLNGWLIDQPPKHSIILDSSSKLCCSDIRTCVDRAILSQSENSRCTPPYLVTHGACGVFYWGMGWHITFSLLTYLFCFEKWKGSQKFIHHFKDQQTVLKQHKIFTRKNSNCTLIALTDEILIGTHSSLPLWKTCAVYSFRQTYES
jgi:hypothetical protein